MFRIAPAGFGTVLRSVPIRYRARAVEKMKVYYLYASISAAVLLTGCGQFSSVALDPADMQNRRIIAFAGCDEEKSYRVFDSGQEWLMVLGAAATGVAGGPIAAQAASASVMQQRKSASPLDLAAARAHFDAARFAETNLTSGLQSAGYSVETFSASHERTIGGTINFAPSYDNAPQNADLILDCAVAVTYGNGRTTAYVPYVSLLLRMEDRKTGRVLMMHKFTYAGSDDGKPLAEGALVADTKYNYASLDGLRTSPERAIQSFENGIDVLTSLAVRSLRG